MVYIACESWGTWPRIPPSKSTGDIVDVEPGEAEWTLDVLEGLFDFFFVQPAKTVARKAALDAKLGRSTP